MGSPPAGSQGVAVKEPDSMVVLLDPMEWKTREAAAENLQKWVAEWNPAYGKRVVVEEY